MMGKNLDGKLGGRYMVVILKVSDKAPDGGNVKEIFRNILEESINWWHNYLEPNDELHLDEWDIFLLDLVDEHTLNRILDAMSRVKNYA